MFYKKKGYPESGEIVICTVKKVLPHSIFCYIDEYEGKEGMIHISEVSPGRIRNIRDYVKEGKKVICKVLKIDLDKGHIDLSLRRVNQAQKINKNQSYKQEQKAEKLLELVGKNLKKTLGDMYKEIGHKLIEDYDSLYESFQEIVANPDLIKELKLDKKLEKELLETVLDKIKAPEYKITAIIKLELHTTDAIETIKKLFSKIEKEGIEVFYISAPKYKIEIIAEDYQTAEEELEEIQEFLEKEVKKLKGIIEFKRKND